jgi:hypothetical protein
MRICEDVIIGYSTDEEGNETPNYTQYCYETGETDTPDTVTDDVDYSKIYDWNVNIDGSKQKLNADGSLSYQDPDGSTYIQNDEFGACRGRLFFEFHVPFKSRFSNSLHQNTGFVRDV